MLKRFFRFEKPTEVVDPWSLSLRTAGRDLSYDSIPQLYAKLREGVTLLSEGSEPLIIGPSKAQISNQDIGLPGDMRTYDIFLFAINTVDDALRAIDQIVQEGEGQTDAMAQSTLTDDCCPTDADGGLAALEPHTPHYIKLWCLHQAYERELQKDPAFTPSRNVVSNPTTRLPRLRGAGPEASVISNRNTREVAELFNDVYDTMLVTLVRSYSPTDETPEERKSLELTAFFPLMTMAVRPLAEILTTLPAGDAPDGKMAGPPFESYRDLHYLPYKASAWPVIAGRLDAIAASCGELAGTAGAPPRLTFIHQNLHTLAINFRTRMNLALPAWTDRTAVTGRE